MVFFSLFFVPLFAYIYSFMMIFILVPAINMINIDISAYTVAKVIYLIAFVFSLITYYKISKHLINNYVSDENSDHTMAT